MPLPPPQKFLGGLMLWDHFWGYFWIKTFNYSGVNIVQIVHTALDSLEHQVGPGMHAALFPGFPFLLFLLISPTFSLSESRLKTKTLTRHYNTCFCALSVCEERSNDFRQFSCCLIAGSDSPEGRLINPRVPATAIYSCTYLCDFHSTA